MDMAKRYIWQNANYKEKPIETLRTEVGSIIGTSWAEESTKDVESDIPRGIPIWLRSQLQSTLQQWVFIRRLGCDDLAEI